MTIANEWIIGLINRIHEQFLHCGFSYVYEEMSELHIIEVTDPLALESFHFRELAGQETHNFLMAFPEEGILFTDPENCLPIAPPILYKKDAIVQEAWTEHSYYQSDIHLIDLDVKWPHKADLESARELFDSLVYEEEIFQQPTATVTIPGDSFAPGDYNYAMAA
ncbi:MULTISPECIES: hypothetical protein [Larkinella]|jgi:hypothetical protein|uniref:Uncharacterized protein n=1 Tax=Larkinella humicola TaxID=2607654 RepID=A0A5N1JLY4_9BACT|nr:MULTISPECIES: hypothetical protein [Larkinella]KAA9356878.1 hypothetical protein F0P93_03820 [Larkinella humicola]